MLLRLFVTSFFVFALSLVGMEIPDVVYNSARYWSYCPVRKIIEESLQGLSDFTGNVIPRSLWNKAKKAAKKTIPAGEVLFPSDYKQRIFDMIPEVMEGIGKLISMSSGKNIACVRVFVLLESGDYAVHNIPYIFSSGVSISPRIPEDVRWLIRNIASYDFVSSSSQAFAHSERAFALSLLTEELSLSYFRRWYSDIKGWVIQFHNISQEMCPTCKSFFRNESPYFIDVNGTGYFVGKEYLIAHKEASSEWDNFMKFNAGRIKVGDLYSEYLAAKECVDDDENRKSFLEIMQPYSFKEIISGFEESPIVLFSHASSEYEECLVFKF